MPHYVYLLECDDANNTYYIGYTSDLERRIEEHNAGNGAKYTRGRRPVTVQYVELWESRSAAMGREYELKQLTRTEKEKLVSNAEDCVTIEPALEESD